MLWISLVAIYFSRLRVLATTDVDVLDSLTRLRFDDEGHLSHHYLLYTNTCSSRVTGQLASAQYRSALAATPELMTQFTQAQGVPLSDCSVVCVQRGVPRAIVQHVLPYHILQSEDIIPDDLAQWVSAKCDRVELGVVNNLEAPVNLFWINERGERLHVALVDHGGEKNMHWMESYIGHVFEVEDSETARFITTIVVEHDTFIAIGESPPSRGDADHLDKLDGSVHDLFDGEWQGKQLTRRSFTPLGFAKGQLPRDVWASMYAFYHNNRNNRIVEDFSFDILVNWWRSESYLVTMPPTLRVYWQSRLKDLVEAWTGVKLELTDIYGVRRYEDGARLLMHVDRINTHAASMIVNVAQLGVKRPWPVQIYDHADRLHEVNMEPGEILYYESAKCLHGRMAPLHGGAYVNIFSHYRPLEEGEEKGNPHWYSRPNPAGTPEPIMHSSDFCDGPYASTAAVCDTALHGKPFAHARSGDDLFELWKHAEQQ